MRFIERIQNLWLTSTEYWSKKADHLGGCFLMPYKKNHAYQDNEWFAKQRNMLDVRTWNRDLINQTFYQTCQEQKQIQDYSVQVESFC